MGPCTCTQSNISHIVVAVTTRLYHGSTQNGQKGKMTATTKPHLCRSHFLSLSPSFSHSLTFGSLMYPLYTHQCIVQMPWMRRIRFHSLVFFFAFVLFATVPQFLYVPQNDVPGYCVSLCQYMCWSSAFQQQQQQQQEQQRKNEYCIQLVFCS